MLRKNLFIALILSFMMPCIAQPIENPSLNQLQKNVKNHPKSAIHHYNLGTYFLQKNQLGHAVLYLEKAKKLNPRDPDTRHNLKLSHTKLIDPLAGKQHFFSLIHAAIAYLRFQEWLLLLAGAQFLLILLKKTDTNSNTIKMAQWVVLGLFSLPLIGSFLALKTTEIIILSKRIELKQSPSHAVETTFNAHQGVKAILLEDHHLWVKIKCQNGITGWVEKKELGKI